MEFTVNVPRPKVRKGDNKKKAEGEDLFEIAEILDKSSCQLPVIVATDSNNILCIKAADADLCVMIVKVEKLQDMIEEMKSQISVISEEQLSINKPAMSQGRPGNMDVNCPVVTQNWHTAEKTRTRQTCLWKRMKRQGIWKTRRKLLMLSSLGMITNGKPYSTKRKRKCLLSLEFVTAL